MSRKRIVGGAYAGLVHILYIYGSAQINVTEVRVKFFEKNVI